MKKQTVISKINHLRQSGCLFRGFTLIELLVVVAILGLLLGLLLPFVAGAIQRNKAQGTATDMGAALTLIHLLQDKSPIPADHRLAIRRQKTILFVDEIHRFNKAQQDAFLPHVEKGTVILVGATTENPSFEVVAPLLSRS